MLKSCKSLYYNDFGGAGYGNRTRLTGLGSQDITTMLSPLAACDYRGPLRHVSMRSR